MYSRQWNPDAFEEEFYNDPTQYRNNQFKYQTEMCRRELEQDKDPEERYAPNKYILAGQLSNNQDDKRVENLLHPEMKFHQISDVLKATGINSVYNNRVEFSNSIPQPIGNSAIDQNSARSIVLSSDVFKENTSSDAGLSELEENLIKISISNEQLPLIQRYRTLFNSSQGTLKAFREEVWKWWLS